jgi:hypothetical protein
MATRAIRYPGSATALGFDAEFKEEVAGRYGQVPQLECSFRDATTSCDFPAAT